VLSSLEDQEYAFLQQLMQSPSWQAEDPEKAIFFEMVATAVASKGDTKELTDLLSMLNVKQEAFGWQQKAVLTGIAMQGNQRSADPIRLTSAPAIFSHTEAFDPGVQTRLNTLTGMFTWPGHEAVAASAVQNKLVSEADRKQFASGRQYFLTVCAGCHGTDGAGLKRFAPPLIGSEWVLGDEKRLALILLHGVEGPIEVNGKYYDAPDILPVMPSHSVMEDGEIAAILTYIRNEWGNAADPVRPGTVGRIRHTSQGRVVPWSAAELKEVTSEAKAEGS
jgi:mono/diheme cytochrome c family protein